MAKKNMDEFHFRGLETFSEIRWLVRVSNNRAIQMNQGLNKWTALVLNLTQTYITRDSVTALE